MADRNIVVRDGGSKAVWFVAGALVVAALIGAYLYSDGYFDRSARITIEVPSIQID